MLEKRFNLPLRARYAASGELIGGVHARGAQRNITLYFVSGKFDKDVKYVVDAKVVSKEEAVARPLGTVSPAPPGSSARAACGPIPPPPSRAAA